MLFRSVTLRAVGETAGVSRGAPYRHFKGKAELLAAVAARELDRLAARFEDETACSGAPDVEEALGAYLDWALLYPERFRLTFGRWEIEDQSLGAAAARARLIFIRAVTAAQADGRLPPANSLRLGVLLLAAVHGIADLELAGQLGPARTGLADAKRLVADLFSYLRPSTNGPAGV